MWTLSANNMSHYIYYNTEFQLAIYIQCRVGLPSMGIARHFKLHHNAMWKEHRKSLTLIRPGIDMSIPLFKVGDRPASGGATTDFNMSIPTLKIKTDISIPRWQLVGRSTVSSAHSVHWLQIGTLTLALHFGSGSALWLRLRILASALHFGSGSAFWLQLRLRSLAPARHFDSDSAPWLQYLCAGSALWLRLRGLALAPHSYLAHWLRLCILALAFETVWLRRLAPAPKIGSVSWNWLPLLKLASASEIVRLERLAPASEIGLDSWD